MRGIVLNALGIAGLALVLGGCTSGSYVQSAPGHPVSDMALADEVYLDGTGPTARRLGHAARQPAETLYSAPPAGGPTRAVVRSRPLAIERADAVSSTTGARTSAAREADKPFSESWWAKERAEDARLKSKMNICRGC